MKKNKSAQMFGIKEINKDSGFGLVDAIVSMSLLIGVITYGIYFSAARLNTVYNSNLTRSINKEIERDIERLKSDFWSMGFDKYDSQYLYQNYSLELINSTLNPLDLICPLISSKLIFSLLKGVVF